VPDPAAGGRPSTATPFEQRQRVEQSHAHVVLSADGDDDESVFRAAKAEEEAARGEAAAQRQVLARVTVADPENPEETLEFAVVEPFKAIKSKDDLERFKQSKSYGPY